jgi:hypothetical protein
MNVLVRVSKFEKRTDQQKNDKKIDLYLIEDKCSGSIHFFNHEGGKKILTFIEKGMAESMSCQSIDIYSHDLLDILSEIKFMIEKPDPTYW